MDLCAHKAREEEEEEEEEEGGGGGGGGSCYRSNYDVTCDVRQASGDGAVTFCCR